MDASVQIPRAVANRAVANLALVSIVGFAVVLAATMAAHSADLKDPLSPLASAGSSMLCFRRDYSPEHLAQHPKQTTTTVLLAFQPGYYGFQQARVSFVLTPRAGVAKRIVAGCLWWEGAGIGPSGHRMFPGFDKPAGFNCVVTVGGNSAQEGGALLIDPAQDAKSLTLFVQSPVFAFDDQPGKTRGSFRTLDPEDGTFALTRIEPKACASLESVRE